MINIVIFSDLQYDSYYSFDKRIDPKTGLTYRHSACRKALRDLAEYCQENSVDYVICLGDLVDKKNETSSHVLYTLKEDLEILGDSISGKIYSLSGNHDFMDKSSTRSILKILESSKFEAIESTHSIHFLNVSFFFVSDIEEKEKHYRHFAEKYSEVPFKVLFSHVGIGGAQMSSTLTSDSPIKLSDLHPESFRYVFLGDYHAHQELMTDRVFYCGALLQKTFGEEGNPQHFAHLQIDESLPQSQLKWVPVSAPQFRNFSYGEKIPSDFYGYLKIRNESPISVEDIETLRSSLPSTVLASFVDIPVQTSSIPRLSFEIDSSFEAKCLQFLRERAPSELNLESLTRRLNSLLSI
jgi:DNA repair exonuclease SbcCD nuclease subunit